MRFKVSQAASNSGKREPSFQQKKPVHHVMLVVFFHFAITAAHNCQWNVGHVVITD